MTSAEWGGSFVSPEGRTGEGGGDKGHIPDKVIHILVGKGVSVQDNAPYPHQSGFASIQDWKFLAPVLNGLYQF